MITSIYSLLIVFQLDFLFCIKFFLRFSAPSSNEVYLKIWTDLNKNEVFEIVFPEFWAKSMGTEIAREFIL